MDRVPTEILDAILRNLLPQNWEQTYNQPWNGKRDMDYCSLVSHRWNAVSRPLLFRDVIFTPLGIPVRGKSLPRALESFADFLEQSPHLSTYIRRLRLDFMCKKLGVSAHSAFVARQQPGTFARVLKALPCIRVLHLHNVVFESSAPPLDIPRIPLSRLRISYYSDTYRSGSNYYDVTRITRQSHQNTVQILAHFSRVDELTYFAWNKPSDDLASPKDIHPVEVSSLVLPFALTSDLNKFLPHCIDLRAVRRAILSMKRYHDWARAKDQQQLLDAISGHVEDLRYDMGLVPGSIARDEVLLDVSHCRSLESLALSFEIHSLGHSVNGDQAHPWSSTLQCAQLFLSRAQHPNLRELVLLVGYGTYDHFKQDTEQCRPQLDRLEHELNQFLTLSRVQRIRIEYQSSDLRDPQEALEDFADLFPQLTRDGALQLLPVSCGQEFWETFSPEMMFGS